MYDRAGQRSGNAWDALDLRYDEAAKVIHVVRLGANDHVVGAGDVVGLGDAADLPDGRGHIGGFADLSLDEDVSLDHRGLLVIFVLDTLPQGDHVDARGRRWRAATVRSMARTWRLPSQSGS